jgi:hypothetical protein
MTGTRLFVQVAFKVEDLTLASDELLFALRNDSGLDGCLKLSLMETGAVRLRDSNSAIVVTSAGGIVSEGVWHYLRVDATIGASAAVKVYVDSDTPIIDESSVDTQDTETDVDMVVLAGASASSSYGVWFDDIVVIDTEGSGLTTMQADCRIFTLKPDALTSTDDWSLYPNSGEDSYEDVDDPIAPTTGDDDADGTYVYDPGTSLDEVRWTYEDVGLTYDVKAVGMAITGRKTDSGNGRIQAKAYGSATPHAGSIFDLSTDYQVFRSYMELAADDSGWTAAKVNAHEFGVQVYNVI